MKQLWLVIGALVLVLYGVVAIATTATDLWAEQYARTFVEAVKTGDQATYDRMLAYPSREDSATARGIRAFRESLDGALFYEVKGTKHVMGGPVAVLVEIQLSDSDDGQVGVLMVDDLLFGARIWPDSGALLPETWGWGDDE